MIAEALLCLQEQSKPIFHQTHVEFYDGLPTLDTGFKELSCNKHITQLIKTAHSGNTHKDRALASMAAPEPSY